MRNAQTYGISKKDYVKIEWIVSEQFGVLEPKEIIALIGGVFSYRMSDAHYLVSGILIGQKLGAIENLTEVEQIYKSLEPCQRQN